MLKFDSAHRPMLEKNFIWWEKNFNHIFQKKFFFSHRSIYIPKYVESNFMNIGVPDLFIKRYLRKTVLQLVATFVRIQKNSRVLFRYSFRKIRSKCLPKWMPISLLPKTFLSVSSRLVHTKPSDLTRSTSHLS